MQSCIEQPYKHARSTTNTPLRVWLFDDRQDWDMLDDAREVSRKPNGPTTPTVRTPVANGELSPFKASVTLADYLRALA